MTIKEIAAIANVSVSTVSKIINKKDQGISDETRQRVMKIVKEYNYSPYAKFQPAASSLLLGISIVLHAGHEQLMTSIVKAAREEGYSTIICTSASSEDEEKNLSVLCSHNVDGIIMDRVLDSSEEGCAYVEKQGIPLQIIDAYRGPDYSYENSLSVDYSALGYAAANKLIEQQHRHLGCILSGNDYKNDCLLEGFKRCLFDHGITFEEEMAQTEAELSSHVLRQFTGVVCADYELAVRLNRQADSLNLKIPRDLSVVAISPSVGNGDSESISTVKVPFEELGRRCVSKLIGQIEDRPQNGLPIPLEYKLNHTNSIDIPANLRGNKIVVVGSINMDTLIHFGSMPQIGETMSADNRTLIPGGKGLNQALAASKLGADTYLIGKIGKDHDGSVLHDYLKLHNVNTEGVTDDPNTPTGTAYIYIRSDGESSIVVYKGANQHIRAQDINRFEDLFRNASFCLLQAEISMEVVEYAAKMARKHRAKVILKPCVVSELSDSLLKYVDILLPNEMEANRLLGTEMSYEEKAQYFLDRGVGTVIITLGPMGCYLRDAARSKYFDAADVAVVDTTGAADAFAATLAVYLSRGHSIETATSYATYAAGISTTRQGVPPALVDQNTLNLYVPDVSC